MEPILIITRPAPSGEAFARSVIAALGRAVPVIDAPALQIVPIAYQFPDDASQIIFTSPRAVVLAPDGNGRTAWCVGNATAAAAAARHYAVHSAAGDADALVGLILAQRPRGRLVHLAGRHRRGAIAARLTAAGLRCDTIEIYDQVPLDVPDTLHQATQGDAPLVAPIFSPRSAQGLRNLSYRAPLHIVAISPAVAAAFRGLDAATLLTTGHPDADHMRDMTVAVLRSLTAPDD
ncbi:uroporphyrinogen-III synthase [Loktanella atrilutea]|uniref:Uroporphyrinogen-III synthase n=1 Tax=Loktanella atrilutea TaxID=366533 RepID=A0A1M4YME4_LOKAT|nr:uroporphyrinogen-III synthase [Loktanella atrilutea]SHF06546.1 uroporphyrinogen-III synthase [Loktanella atrilutea]